MSGNNSNNNDNKLDTYFIEKRIDMLEEKIESFRKGEIIESKRFTNYASTIIGCGIAIISVGIGVNGFIQSNAILGVADYGNKTIENLRKNLSELEKNTKEKIDSYVGSRNITGYEIISYDERDRKKITALLTDIQRKYDDISIYSIGVIVPIKIVAEGESLGELLGLSFRVSGELANTLSIQGKNVIQSQMKIITTSNYFGVKDLFFSKKVPVGFSFTIAGLSNKCEDYSAIKERYSNEISGKIYITPIIKNYTGEYREDVFDISIDSARLDISCLKSK